MVVRFYNKVGNVTLKSEDILEPLRQGLVQLNDCAEHNCVNSRRVFHGRGRCFNGLEWCSLDAFERLLLMTVYIEPPPDLFAQVEALLIQYLPAGITEVVVQRRDQPKAPCHWLVGRYSEENIYVARRNNLQFLLNFKQQNCGFFLDIEPGRLWLEKHAHQANILNLFAYTCAFSVVAIEAGARQVVNVDMSRRSLTVGRENHRLNGHDTSSIQFFGVDILKSWGKIRRDGPYDLIVVDPPSFQKGSFVATQDYRKVVRRLPELLAPEGKVLACLNAPEFGADYLESTFREHAPELIYRERLAPSKDFCDIDLEHQLKLLVFEQCL